MRTLRFEPSSAKRCETTSELSDGGPEGARAAGPSNPSLSAIQSCLPRVMASMMSGASQASLIIWSIIT